jgi:membrane protein DedA with SNARE-associated domain
MLVGTTHMPIKKYAAICSLIILPRTIFLVFVGYYFGSAYEIYTARFQKDAAALVIIFALAFLAYFAVKKLSSQLAKRIEKV